MQALRRARLFARLVLAWFALALGVAIAAPLVQPVPMEMVCSGGGGLKLLVNDADGGMPQARIALDCVLCAGLDAPPPDAPASLHAVPALAHAVAPIESARIAALVAGPPPARGPPASGTA